MNRLCIEQLAPLPSLLLVGTKMNVKEEKEEKNTILGLYSSVLYYRKKKERKKKHR